MLDIDDIRHRCFNTFRFHVYGPLPFERLFLARGGTSTAAAALYFPVCCEREALCYWCVEVVRCAIRGEPGFKLIAASYWVRDRRKDFSVLYLDLLWWRCTIISKIERYGMDLDIRASRT